MIIVSGMLLHRYTGYIPKYYVFHNKHICKRVNFRLVIFLLKRFPLIRQMHLDRNYIEQDILGMLRLLSNGNLIV